MSSCIDCGSAVCSGRLCGPCAESLALAAPPVPTARCQRCSGTGWVELSRWPTLPRVWDVCNCVVLEDDGDPD